MNGVARTPAFELRTMGHATLVVLEDGVPLVATDPWLVGSAYFRSWWLDVAPTEAEIDLVAASRFVYVTHSHPDHLHLPTLRRLGRPRTLHPDLPGYPIPAYLREHGIPSQVLEPGRWYRLTERVRIASIPALADDSILLIDTPVATVVDVNDCAPTRGLLRTLRRRYLTAGRPVVVLGSHSPASSGSTMYRDGVRTPIRSTGDYIGAASDVAAALGASRFVSFASQMRFGRSDSRWANAHKVTTADFGGRWRHPEIEVCKPHSTMDLETLEHHSAYRPPDVLAPEQQALADAREAQEAEFTLPDDFAATFERYLSEVWFVRLILRHGIAWHLTTSGRTFHYDPSSRRLSEDPAAARRADAVVTVSDQVLADLVHTGFVTDLGITMTIRTDSRVDVRRPYLFFSLVGLRDYGHLDSRRALARYARFNARFVVPALFGRWWNRQANAAAGVLDAPPTAGDGTGHAAR